MDTRSYPVGQHVFVYRNVVRRCGSIRVNGRVIAHADTLELSDVEFRVSQSGRARVLRNRRKNVHAGAYGVLVSLKAQLPGGTRQISYNPYTHASFVDRESGRPATAASRVWMVPDGYYARAIDIR